MTFLDYFQQTIQPQLAAIDLFLKTEEPPRHYIGRNGEASRAGKAFAHYKGRISAADAAGFITVMPYA